MKEETTSTVRRRRRIAGGLVAAIAVAAIVIVSWPGAPPPQRAGHIGPSADALAAHCAEVIGEPRIVEPSPGVFVAIAHDLANTIVVPTLQGNLVVDAGSNPISAARVREAMQPHAPGPTAVLVLTHSHIDHVGGASAWIDEGTEVWATDAFREHFFKQYGLFQEAEFRRGAAQFGAGLSHADLPCSAIGVRVDLDAIATSGARMPTHTFTGRAEFNVGELRVVLLEAHGETHDQLFVWLPEGRILMPGDNWYEAFPNLYTIRGTAPRPIQAWIRSLDAMRELEPEVLIPSHTRPQVGRDLVQSRLRAYRDAIQFVHDDVVRRANAGQSIEEIAAGVRLPARLAEDPALQELYGRIDWSARAIYTASLGWFDERVEALLPHDPDRIAQQTIALIGGDARVAEAIDDALAEEDWAWALQLLAWQRAASTATTLPTPAREQQARALRGLAGEQGNANARGYLLTHARIAEGHTPTARTATPSDELLDEIPLSLIFEALPTRLDAEQAFDVHESIAVRLEEDTYTLTVRYGVLEVRLGEPLPGTPDPVATLVTDAHTWRRLAVQDVSPGIAIAAGDLRIEGNLLAARRFMQRIR